MNKSASCFSISESQIDLFIPKSRWEGASKAVHGAPGRKCFLTDSAQGTNALIIAMSDFLVSSLCYVVLLAAKPSAASPREGSAEIIRQRPALGLGLPL